jgi:hypothetical protein
MRSAALVQDDIHELELDDLMSDRQEQEEAPLAQDESQGDHLG